MQCCGHSSSDTSPERGWIVYVLNFGVKHSICLPTAKAGEPRVNSDGQGAQFHANGLVFLNQAERLTQVQVLDRERGFEMEDEDLTAGVDELHVLHGLPRFFHVVALDGNGGFDDGHHVTVKEIDLMIVFVIAAVRDRHLDGLAALVDEWQTRVMRRRRDE